MDAGFSAHQVAPGRDGLLRDRPDAPVWQPLFGYRRRAACRRHPHMAAHDGKLQFLLIGIGHRAGRFLRDAVRLPEDNPPLQKEPLPGLHGVGASLYDNEVTFGDNNSRPCLFKLLAYKKELPRQCGSSFCSGRFR